MKRSLLLSLSLHLVFFSFIAKLGQPGRSWEGYPHLCSKWLHGSREASGAAVLERISYSYWSGKGIVKRTMKSA